jgi:dTDP-glucose pyrophosphorylase
MLRNIEEHLILYKKTVLEALKQLNNLPKTLTLFVVNEKKQLLGTLTDGDIRRGLINGKTLNDPIEHIITKQCYSLSEKIDVQFIKNLKKKGIRLLPVLNENKEISKIYDLNALHSILPLDVVIMAGGRGERLRPITDSVPKPMIQLGNKPIIEHTIDHLTNFGIEKIYISVNYLKEQIDDYFGDGSKKGIQIQYIEETKPLGTAGALTLIKNYNKDVLLTNSDLFTSIDYEDLYLAFMEKNADIAIASVPYTVNIPYAILEERENSVQSFEEKPSNTHYANAGIYIIKKELLKEIPQNTFYNATDLIQFALDRKLNVVHNQIVGYWIDIGKNEDLLRAQEIMKHIESKNNS